MIAFSKAHAYGNDFLYVTNEAVAGLDLTALARDLCDRHAGIGADGLVIYERTAAGASMRLFNADGSRAEISGNGVRGLGALLLRGTASERVEVTVFNGGRFKATRAHRARGLAADVSDGNGTSLATSVRWI